MAVLFKKKMKKVFCQANIVQGHKTSKRLGPLVSISSLGGIFKELVLFSPCQFTSYHKGSLKPRWVNFFTGAFGEGGGGCELPDGEGCIIELLLSTIRLMDVVYR